MKTVLGYIPAIKKYPVYGYRSMLGCKTLENM